MFKTEADYLLVLNKSTFSSVSKARFNHTGHDEDRREVI